MTLDVDTRLWTDKDVRAALVDAYRTLLRSPGSFGPSKLRAFWPDHHIEPADFTQQVINKTFKGRKIRLGSSLEQISQMEKVFGLRNPAGPADNWLAGPLLAYPEHREVLLLWVRASLRGQSSVDLCRYEGWAMATFKRKRDFATGVIADRLNRAKVQLW